MAKINKHIAIVRSDVAGLSSLSHASAESIQKSLKRRYKHVDISVINDLAGLERLVERSPDLVFLGMKFLPINPNLGKHDPSKIWIAAYLDQFGILYTGSNHLAAAYDHDKSLAKQQVQLSGLSTSDFFVATPGSCRSSKDLPLSYPLFIKPVAMGGGQGVNERSVVNNFSEYTAKVKTIFDEYRSASLVEKYLSGREFSVSLLADSQSGELVAMPIELVAE
ncbi:MAG: D-alanine--D-alanine ligase, partial [Candidatus Saccharimonadales bacterium]